MNHAETISFSFIIISYNRKTELQECLLSVLKQNLLPQEILVIDNHSTDATDSLFSEGGPFHHHTLIRYIKLDQNRGVAGGRNAGIRQASGQILFFIDDDALLEYTDTTEKVIQRFQTDPKIGVLAFKIINYHTRTIAREEFPHLNKWLDPEKPFETTVFIGAGHAIRKEVFDHCGLYPEDYFYGGEEFDLSFRILDKGYQIWYFPEALIWHRKSPYGRLSDQKKWILTYRNRLAMAYKYLYYRNVAVIALTWFIKIVLVSGSILTAVKGFREFLRYRKNLIRQPIQKITYKKIAALRGRIWY